MRALLQQTIPNFIYHGIQLDTIVVLLEPNKFQYVDLMVVLVEKMRYVKFSMNLDFYEKVKKNCYQN